MPSPNATELLWTLAALVCVRITWSAWRDARRTCQAVARLQGYAPEQRQAADGVEAELVSLLVQVAFLAVGLLALATPPPVRPEVTLLQQATGVVLVGCEIGLAARSWRAQRARREITRLFRLRRREAKKPEA